MNEEIKQCENLFHKQELHVATSHGNEIYVIWDIDDEDESIEKLLSVIKLKGNE